MLIDSRAIRAAREIVREMRPNLPVPVERIAERFSIVTRMALPDDISGMLVPVQVPAEPRKWAIVVNKSDAPVRQRFTIAHELGHLLMHKYSSPHADGRMQVRFRNEASATGSVREEIEANQFAAELLMPERHVRLVVARLRFDMADPSVDKEALRSLTSSAKRFGVSVQALSFRIANLNLG